MSRDLTEHTLAQFDIVGCFFINKFYSHLYQLAGTKLASGEAKTLTDAYRDLIVSYVRGINQPTIYLQTLKELIHYWSQLTTGLQTTITEFEDKILIEFIPPEYFRDFTSRDRETILQKIIFDAVSTLANECVKINMLSKIIDRHGDESNVTLLQRKMVDHFASIRNVYFEKFVQEISKSNRDSSSQLVEALKQECAQLVRRCSEAEAQRDKLQKMLTIALDKMDELKKSMVVQSAVTYPVATPSHAVHTAHVHTPTVQPIATPSRVRVTPVKPETPTRARARASPLAPQQVAMPPRAHALTTPMRAPARGLVLSELTENAASPLSILDEFQTNHTTVQATGQSADEPSAVSAVAAESPTEEKKDANAHVDVAIENTNDHSENEEIDSEEEYRRQQEQLERRLLG